MTNARRDQDGGMRPDRVGLAVELDRRTLVTTQHHVNFRLSTVVMDRGVTADLRQVHRGWEIGPLGEGAAGRAAGAGDPRERWQIDDLGGCWHCVSACRTSESEGAGRLGIIPKSRRVEKPGRIKRGHSEGRRSFGRDRPGRSRCGPGVHPLFHRSWHFRQCFRVRFEPLTRGWGEMVAWVKMTRADVWLPGKCQQPRASRRTFRPRGRIRASKMGSAGTERRRPLADPKSPLIGLILRSRQRFTSLRKSFVLLNATAALADEICGRQRDLTLGASGAESVTKKRPW